MQRFGRAIERRRQEVGVGVDELVIQVGKEVDGRCGGARLSFLDI
jgi:hypothetical protein